MPDLYDHSDLDEADDLVDGLETLKSYINATPAERASDPLTQRLIDNAVQTHAFIARHHLPATVSLESLDDILTAMSDHVSSGYGKLKQTVLATLGFLSASLPELENHWRAMHDRLHGEAKDPKGQVDSSGLIKRLHVQGNVPDDFSTYMIEYAGHVEQLATSFDHAAQTAVVRNSDLLATLEFDNITNFTVSYNKASEQWDDPRKILHADVFDFIVPGGHAFFMDKGMTYKGEDRAIQRFDQYISKHVPTRVGLIEHREVMTSEHLEPLKLKDMREICTNFIRATENVKLQNKGHTESMAHAQVKAEFFAKRKTEASREVQYSMREAYRYLNRAYGVTYDFGTYMKFNTLKQFVAVSHAILIYMDRSLKAKEPKAEEAPTE